MVETPVADMLNFEGSGPYVIGSVGVAIDPGVEYFLDTASAPWVLGEATEEHLDRANVCRVQAIKCARREASNSDKRSGLIQGARGQRILSVRVNDHCEHDQSGYERRPCGHCYCSRCDGFVDPKKRTALRSAGPVITCNRRPRPFADYDHLFAENMAGSCSLTNAMIEDLKAVKLSHEAWPPGKDRVRKPRDIAWDHAAHDFSERKVFLDHKKEIKARLVLYEHWAPPCETFTQALAQYKMRFAGRPYGEGWTPEENPRAEKLDKHTQIAINVCGEARTKHEVGDYFSVEHIWPTEMVHMTCYEELIGLPGVFIVIFDNCRYQKQYRHRQCLITNAPWLMWLSKDCPGVPEHRHEGQIGFGAKFRTADIAAYPEALVRAWAKIFSNFIRGIQAQTLCPWCAHLHGCLLYTSPSPRDS